MNTSSPETVACPTQRIEAFSDGVFAIAITLLILEIKVPHLHGDEAGQLGGALLRLWPSYVAYLLSFVMIGIYWANHHYIFRFYRRTNHLFNLLNAFFLMCIAFLPFPTAVLAEYIADPQAGHTAIRFYALGLLLPAVGWFAIWLYASTGYRLIDPRLSPSFVNSLTRQYLLSNLLYVIAVAASWWNGRVSLAICVGLTLLYLGPPKEPGYR